MLKPMLRAIAQLDDPVFLGVVLRSVVLAALAFAALFAAAFWGMHHLLAGAGWGGWSWAGGLLGGVGAALLAQWLFLPVAAAIGALYVERIAAAVERRCYPALPPPRSGSLGAQLGDAAAVGAGVLLLGIGALLLALLLPGIGLVLGWLISAWAIGRGLFGAVALRRMGRREAAALHRQRWPTVLAQGGLLVLAGLVPLFNLLIPVLGTAAMVHVLHGGGGAKPAN